ncbi:MAG: GDP-mannose 4,6-dehydratase, partial [Prevotella sp.]|nr:GDP-mannose 4,6-dehydratase [Prevotella sp.]
MLNNNINLTGTTVLVTGAAGFIGCNLCKQLLNTVDNIKVVGLDNMNDYYDVRIKEERLASLQTYSNFTFVKGNLADKALIDKLFADHKPQVVVNLAAQAGVRYSITNPGAYIESNLIGFYNILEACRNSYEQYEGGV